MVLVPELVLRRTNTITPGSWSAPGARLPGVGHHTKGDPMTALRTTPQEGDGRPCHVVARAGDRLSMCGIRDALPRVLARWAGSEHYDRLYCHECVNALNDQPG